MVEKKDKTRKEQIISLRKRYFIIHSLLYFEFLLVVINAAFYTMFLYVLIMNSHSIEVKKIIDTAEWESIIYQITLTLGIYNLLYDIILAILLYTLPVIIIILIRKYRKSIELLPQIYKNYLREKFLRADYFPLLIGMSNGFFIFFVIFFYFHNPIPQYLTIPVIIGLLIPVIYFTIYLIRGGKSKVFKRKFLIGTIIFVGLMILTYLSLV